ncbi:MAG: transposase, partial [Actinobacteria bacterium]|nr:transposase [Actinomycetota bacterium]
MWTLAKTRPGATAESDHECGHHRGDRARGGDDRADPPAVGGQGPAAGRASGRLGLPFGGTGRAGRPAARPHAGLAAAAGPLRPSQSRNRVRQGRVHVRLRRPPSDLPAAGHQLVLVQRTQHDTEAIVVSWATTAGGPCPVRELCTRGKRRHITIRSRELHEALAAARAEQNTDQWKARYAPHAGVEGTMRQATHVTGIRH